MVSAVGFAAALVLVALTCFRHHRGVELAGCAAVLTVYAMNPAEQDR